MRRAALLLEVALHLALVVLLGVATVRFFRMLDSIGVGWPKGLPVALLFAGAAVLVLARAVPKVRRLRRDEDHGNSRLGT